MTADLCALDELTSGEARRFDVEGHRLAVVRIDDDGVHLTRPDDPS